MEENKIVEFENEENMASEDGMKNYLNEISQISLLSSEEEQQLGRLIKERGENWIEARNRLVEANLRLVMYCAKQFNGRGTDLDDLNAMGVEGLIRAAEKFDYSLGYRFSTYATWWIKQAIARGIASESGSIHIPIHAGEHMAKVRRAQQELKQLKGEEPTVEEIVNYTGLPMETVEHAKRHMYQMLSLDAKIGEDGESTLEDLMVNERSADPCEKALQSCCREAIGQVLKGLDDREQLVLSLRYGIGGESPMTLEEVANHPAFGVTRERIRQIENKAIRKLQRSPSAKKLLEEFVA